MKFQDKFARLRQLNSPNSEDKFKNVVSTCINFDKISGEFHSILLFLVIFTGFHENEIFQVQKIMTMISHDPELLTSYELIATPNKCM